MESILTKIINEIKLVLVKKEVELLAFELTEEIDYILMEVLKNLASYYPQAPPAGNSAKMREVIANVNRAED